MALSSRYRPVLCGAPNRRTSKAQRSMPGSPSRIQLAIASPAPPEAAMPAVNPARHEEIVELWRKAEDRFAVGRDRNRPVDDRLDADLVEDWQSLGARQREQFEALHVLGEQFPAELERRARSPAALRSLLPAADRERADIWLEIEVLVGIAERRQRLRQIELLLGDEILVLDDACRERDAGHVGDAFAQSPAQLTR